MNGDKVTNFSRYKQHHSYGVSADSCCTPHFKLLFLSLLQLFTPSTTSKEQKPIKPKI